MSARPEEIQRRLHGLTEIGDVVGALRAIASGHAGAARGALPAIAAYAGTVAQALAAVAPPAQTAPEGPGLVVVVGASQGFSGAYPQHLAEEARRSAPTGSGLLVAGQRTLALLQDGALPILWSADLPVHPGEIPALASRLTDALLDLAPRHPGPIALVAARDLPGQPAQAHRLWPPEAPATAPTHPRALLCTLPPAALIEGLLAEALFAAVTAALMEGLRAENQARVEAMSRAQNNLREKRTEVEQEWQQARQEQMTTELIELTMGREAL